MKASETKLQKILQGEQQYVVPLFQRAYSWDNQQWEILWNDIINLTEEEPMRPHFLGSIVTMQNNSVPEGVAKYLLIDGQQRLTTIFILLAVIRDRSKQNETTTLAQQINDTILLNIFESGLDRYKLQPTQDDRSSFHALIEGQRNSQKNLINDCYVFFDKKLRNLKIHNVDMDFNLIKKAIISGLSVVSITLDDDENPHLVFESLNAKGKPLTQGDLIRNYFFMRVEANKQDPIYAQYWEPMQNNLGDSLTEYIRHFLMKDGIDVKKDNVYFTLKDKINPKNAIEYLQILAKFADYYLKLIDPSQESNQKIRDLLLRLQQLEVTTVYPFLLNCYDDYSNNELSRDEFIQVLDVIENYITRLFVCHIPSSGSDKLFLALYAQIKHKYDRDFVGGLKNILCLKKYPKDDDFKSKFQCYELAGSWSKNRKTKQILWIIEQSFGHKEQVSFDGLSLEHIMPRSLSEDWQKNLGEDWETTHELLLHTIGNLTLTAYNSELSNASFADKREILKESHLELNKKYLTDRDNWTKEDIENRGEYLADLALTIWPYFGPNEGRVKTITRSKGTKPKSLSIRGQNYSVKHWRDVLKITLNFIADELDPNTFDEIVNKYPRLLSWDTTNLRSPYQLNNGVFVELTLSAPDIKSFCLRVLEIAELTEDWQLEVND